MLAFSDRFLQLLLAVALCVCVTYSEANNRRSRANQSGGISLTLNAAAAVNVNQGAKVQASFTAPSNGIFLFQSFGDSSLDPIAYTGSDGNEVLDDDSGGNRNFRFVRTMRARETFSFWSGIFGNEGTGSYMVRVSEAAPPTVSINLSQGVPTAINLISGSRTQVNFTAPSTGVYRFESSNRDVIDPKAFFGPAYGSEAHDDDSGGDNNFLFDHSMRAGESFTFWAGSFNDAGTGSYSVSAVHVAGAPSAPVALNIDVATTVNIASGSRVELVFTAPFSGTFVFESSNSGENDPTAYHYSTQSDFIDDDGAGDYNFKFDRAMSAGETFSFWAGFYGDGHKGSYSVSVHAAAAAATRFTVNNPVTINVNSGARTQVNFTAPASGTFVFQSSNNGFLDPVAYAHLNDSHIIDDDGADNHNFRFERRMSAGETFTFWPGVYADDSNANGSYIIIVYHTSN